VTVEDKLRAAGITPTIEACAAYRLGYKAGRVNLWQEQDKNQYATIIDRATTRVKPS
jgi:hypothetical protein